jgi:hypothetical protein
MDLLDTGSLLGTTHRINIAPTAPLLRRGEDIKEQKQADQTCTVVVKKHQRYPGLARRHLTSKNALL